MLFSLQLCTNIPPRHPCWIIALAPHNPEWIFNEEWGRMPISHFSHFKTITIWLRCEKFKNNVISCFCIYGTFSMDQNWITAAFGCKYTYMQIYINANIHICKYTYTIILYIYANIHTCKYMVSKLVFTLLLDLLPIIGGWILEKDKIWSIRPTCLDGDLNWTKYMHYKLWFGVVYISNS